MEDGKGPCFTIQPIVSCQGQLFKTTGDLSISLAQDGLYGKACQALVSSGVAPNSEETWKLLFTKHPKCEHPITPTAPEFDVSILSSVNIMAILRSFPKLTATGSPCPASY